MSLGDNYLNLDIIWKVVDGANWSCHGSGWILDLSQCHNINKLAFPLPLECVMINDIHMYDNCEFNIYFILTMTGCQKQ